MSLEHFSLNGKVALVTGAGRGIGRGIALALAGAGADLVLAARTHDELDACAQDVRALGRQAEVIVADVGEVGRIQDMVDRALKRFERIDVLANVAGINRRKPALEITENDWDAVQAVNLKGVFFACQSVAAAMIRQGGGKIINIASLTSAIGISNVSPYGASKGGVVALTRALAIEWARWSIQVNAIGPGYIETPMTRPLFEDPERSAWIHSRIPAGRRGYTGDLAGAAVFLASSASDYLTGQVIYVDGGWLAG